MGIWNGSNFRVGFESQHVQSIQYNRRAPGQNGWVDFDQLPMSQAKKQAEQLANLNEDDQLDDWDDDYFNSETYWKESNTN